ncbi:hypothetical protein [uncultured Campylobacter sp.]|uniref:hypothetical protein n=1 Tax=uncultured Campylobacter sp. TaxID=218934 RepID=UPI00262035AE|nr:hypothetical protein [uncultured Campylobacter sp.]
MRYSVFYALNLELNLIKSALCRLYAFAWATPVVPAHDLVFARDVYTCSLPLKFKAKTANFTIKFTESNSPRKGG